MFNWINKSHKKEVSLTLADYFTDIFVRNAWMSSESASGFGSTLSQTENLRKELGFIIDQLAIQSIVDIPCGDANWMRTENFFSKEYLGIDIVPQVITRNIELRGSDQNIDFKVGDFTSKLHIKTSDLVITRDLLVHLSYRDIVKCLDNFLLSGSKYLGLTTFHSEKANEDLVYPESLEKVVGWRPLNLEIPPFLFRNSVAFIDEKCTEKDGTRVFSDKTFAIYDMNSVRDARNNLKAFLGT